jgi:serine O-acetyltransferase
LVVLEPAAAAAVVCEREVVFLQRQDCIYTCTSVYKSVFNMSSAQVESTNSARVSFDIESSWSNLRAKALDISCNEIALQAMLNRMILNHSNLGSAVAHLLSSELADLVMFEIWNEILLTLFSDGSVYEDIYGLLLPLIVCDLNAVLEQDPAAYDCVNVFLFLKGFKAITAHRVAHVLWKSGRQHLALMIQSRCSSLHAVDIHPGAVIGPGLVLDHVRLSNQSIDIV